ncbi:hypothetical protein [Amycolatopsis sp.]|uniref:hypothetical protein n=1 Tax=Amycolatopsis sp. TaxID=37632 RepID=UPI002CCF7FB1|nr:hypothetical protein [Amycolatopsis sp.]HVV08963.1 hypothetical protein [Amycolatopsis sp.]
MAVVGSVTNAQHVWHDLTRIWRTPGKGEELAAATMEAPLAERAGRMAGLGMPPAVAEAVAVGQNAGMGAACSRCTGPRRRSSWPHRAKNCPWPWRAPG